MCLHKKPLNFHELPRPFDPHTVSRRVTVNYEIENVKIGIENKTGIEKGNFSTETLC